MTHDRLGEVNLLSKIQLPSSYGSRVKVNPLNESIGNEGVYRTAPATPGLLIIRSDTSELTLAVYFEHAMLIQNLTVKDGWDRNIHMQRT